MIITKFDKFKLINEEFIDKINFRFKKEEIEDFLLLLLDCGFKYEYGDDEDDDDENELPGQQKANSERYITKGIFTNDQFQANPHHSSVESENIRLAYKVNLFKKIRIEDISIVMNKVLKDIESNKIKLGKVNLELYYDFSISDDDDYESRYSFTKKKKLVMLEFVFADKQKFDDTALKVSINNKKFQGFIDDYISDNNYEDDILNTVGDDGKVILVCKDKKIRNKIYNLFWNMDNFIKFKKSDSKKDILAGLTYIKTHDIEMFTNHHDESDSPEDEAYLYDSYLEFKIERYPTKEENENVSIAFDELSDIWNDFSDNDENWIGYDIYDEFMIWTYSKYVILECRNNKITRKQEKAVEKCMEKFEEDKADDQKFSNLTIDFEVSTDKLIILEVESVTT